MLVLACNKINEKYMYIAPNKISGVNFSVTLFCIKSEHSELTPFYFKFEFKMKVQLAWHHGIPSIENRTFKYLETSAFSRLVARNER